MLETISRIDLQFVLTRSGSFIYKRVRVRGHGEGMTKESHEKWRERERERGREGILILAAPTVEAQKDIL